MLCEVKINRHRLEKLEIAVYKGGYSSVRIYFEVLVSFRFFPKLVLMCSYSMPVSSIAHNERSARDPGIPYILTPMLSSLCVLFYLDGFEV